MHAGVSAVKTALKINLQPGQQVPNHVIIRALRFWQMENPALQVQVQKKGSKFWFVPLTQGVPYQEVFSDDWLKEFHEISREKLDPEGILWKVRRVSGSGNFLLLMFVVKHSIADGLSLCQTLVQFVDILSDILNGKQPEGNKNKEVSLLPPMEHFLRKFKMSPWWLPVLNSSPKKLKKSVIMKVLAPSSKKFWEEHKKIIEIFSSKGNDILARPLPMHLTREETLRLLTITRLHQATVYGVVAAAARQAVQQMFEEKSSIPVKNLKFTTFNKTTGTLSFRQVFKNHVPKDHLGLYLGSTTQNIPRLEQIEGETEFEHFWKMARKYSEDMRRQLRTRLRGIVAHSYVANIALEACE